MGGGTWVYLGTFDFDRGCNEFNRVICTNQSSKRGIVTTDAVRFGGGMGNIEREGNLSELPRCLEGARYYAQWAGAPYKVYSGREGKNDYADDINTRSLMTNWLGGGSVYMPALEGKMFLSNSRWHYIAMQDITGTVSQPGAHSLSAPPISTMVC